MRNLKKDKRIKKQGFMKGVFILLLSQILIKAMGLVYRMYLTNREGFGDKGRLLTFLFWLGYDILTSKKLYE